MRINPINFNNNFGAVRISKTPNTIFQTPPHVGDSVELSSKTLAKINPMIKTPGSDEQIRLEAITLKRRGFDRF